MKEHRPGELSDCFASRPTRRVEGGGWEEEGGRRQAFLPRRVGTGSGAEARKKQRAERGRGRPGLASSGRREIGLAGAHRRMRSRSAKYLDLSLSLLVARKRSTGGYEGTPVSHGSGHLAFVVGPVPVCPSVREPPAVRRKNGTRMHGSNGDGGEGCFAGRTMLDVAPFDNLQNQISIQHLFMYSTSCIPGANLVGIQRPHLASFCPVLAMVDQILARENDGIGGPKSPPGIRVSPNA